MKKYDGFHKYRAEDGLISVIHLKASLGSSPELASISPYHPQMDEIESSVFKKVQVSRNMLNTMSDQESIMPLTSA